MGPVIAPSPSFCHWTHKNGKLWVLGVERGEEALTGVYTRWQTVSPRLLSCWLKRTIWKLPMVHCLPVLTELWLSFGLESVRLLCSIGHSTEQSYSLALAVLTYPAQSIFFLWFFFLNWGWQALWSQADICRRESNLRWEFEDLWVRDLEILEDQGFPGEMRRLQRGLQRM